MSDDETLPRGAKIYHKRSTFEKLEAGSGLILTLADTNVLNDLGTDINDEDDLKLENQLLLAEEKKEYQKKVSKHAYDVYDAMEGKITTLLPQYDEENLEFTREAFSLETLQPKLDYLEENYGEQRAKPSLADITAVLKKEDEEEDKPVAEQIEFRAPVKRVKLRKKQSTQDLIAQLEATAPVESELRARHDSEKLARDAQRALEQLAQKERAYQHAKQKAEEAREQLTAIAQSTIKAELKEERIEGEDENGNIIFDPTEEFCKNLAATEHSIFAAQQKRKQKAEELRKQREVTPEEEEQQVQQEKEVRKQYEKKLEEVEVLHEPRASGSLQDALELIRQKGFISKEYSGRSNDRIVDLSFDDPAPEIRLERLDQTGREMTQKEAFRQLSYKFHGKAPGKAKQEKRMRKIHEEERIRSMQSLDTPLHGLEALRKTQELSHSAYVVLQGGASDHLGLQQQGSRKDKQEKRKANHESEVAGSESMLEVKRMRK